ncbi:MXAN_2561 family MXYO-CTERM-anchored protein [Myxococcus hansupus]|uniref:MXAN_2561 family MXYO-CTERM-anchored protein n=1 Tax=Pseudomyxococcus hansupus TaxID=1297742 RepID=UPI000B261BCB|nr:MXAN_2561 family MXYO-CTERM-anchored protein [Myxococcus hansupus]
MRLTLVGLLLFASTALGQQTVTFSAPATILQNNRIVVSQANCTAERNVTWTRTGNLCEPLYLWLSSDGTCNRAPAATDRTLLQIASGDTTTMSGTLSLRASEALAATGQTCESQTTEKSFRLCASTNRFVGDIIGTTCQDSVSSIGTPTIDLVYDPEPPPVPPAPAVTGLDSALSATVTVPTGATLMAVEVLSLVAGEDGGTGTGEPLVSKEQTAANTTFRLDGLENGVEYAVRAIAIDAAGNRSQPSEVTRGTPIASEGFYGGYVGAGGAETGGCTAAGGGITGCAVLASLGIWLSSRRKRS